MGGMPEKRLVALSVVMRDTVRVLHEIRDLGQEAAVESVIVLKMQVRRF